MAIVPIGQVYYGDPLDAPTAQLLYFPLLSDGTITDIQLKGTGFNAGLGNWLFNVSVAGANVFSGAGRITFNSGVNDVTKTGLSVAGSKGDIVVLNLEQSAGGVIQSPISLIITFDDGTTAGGGTEYLPDIAPSSPNAFDDEFTAGTLDGKWTKYGSSDLVETFANGSLNMGALSNSNGFTGIYQAIPSGAWDWITKIIFPQGAIGSGQVDFSLAIFDNAASTAVPLVVAPMLDAFGSTFNLPGVYLFSDRTTFGSTIEAPQQTNVRNSEAAAPFTCIYLRVKRTANAYRFFLSLNGIGWFEVGTGIADITSAPTSFTPNHIGLLVRNTSGSTRNVAFVDWTRIYTALPTFMGG